MSFNVMLFSINISMSLLLLLITTFNFYGKKFREDNKFYNHPDFLLVQLLVPQDEMREVEVPEFLVLGL